MHRRARRVLVCDARRTMIVFINEDEAYLAWLAARRRIGRERTAKPTPRYLVLHRASCAEVSGANHARCTKGPYIKICSHSAAELAEWAVHDVGGVLRPCEECHPPHDDTAPAAYAAEHPHLTRMGDRLLSYILELAVISMDGMGDYADDPPTIKKLAGYFGKTVPQLEPIVRRCSRTVTLR